MNITTIPIEQLENDLQDSRNDISIYELALSQDIQTYSGGLVKDRLRDNKRFVEVITAELNRRADIKESSEQQTTVQGVPAKEQASSR